MEATVQSATIGFYQPTGAKPLRGRPARYEKIEGSKVCLVLKDSTDPRNLDVLGLTGDNVRLNIPILLKYVHVHSFKRHFISKSRLRKTPHHHNKRIGTIIVNTQTRILRVSQSKKEIII